jgi:hypothetical protein
LIIQFRAAGCVALRVVPCTHHVFSYTCAGMRFCAVISVGL